MNENAIEINRESIEHWRDQKFGMFIHWGLYSLQGDGAWSMWVNQTDKDQYKKLADQFTAENFHADDWATLAKEAGMNYMVLTAKHHEGFSLWDSKSCLDDFTSVHSAAKRDIVKEYTDACRKAGLMVGLYYSPLDWRFPGFFLPRLFKESATALVKQAYEQTKELVTHYGKIDILWFDGGENYWVAHGLNVLKGKVPEDFKSNPAYPDFWKADKIDQMVRTLQKGIICNDRLGDKQFGDYFCPEKKIGAFNINHAWETCDTLAGDWGYTPNCKTRSLRSCIQLLVNVVVAGGNLLLNVGPRPDGSIEPEQAERLKEIGEWLKQYGESIYKTRGGPIKCEDWGGTTNIGNTMFVHVCEWTENEIIIPDVGNPEICCITGAEPLIRKENGKIYLSVDNHAKQEMDTIFKLTYTEKVTDIFKDVIDYQSLSDKKKDFTCSVNLG
ncbi:MAG: glycoside hydrolase family 29 [Ruminococcaceae bacterium]|nr:glycoside hydrolase family 29 [Oscillospiraceae bacterium]